MSYDIKGTIVKIGDTQRISDNFMKRELWIDTEEKYRNQLSIEYKQDKVDLLDTVSIGDEVSCSVNIEGNEYNGKRYTSLGGWKLHVLNGSAQTSQPDETPVDDEDESSIPF